MPRTDAWLKAVGAKRGKKPKRAKKEAKCYICYEELDGTKPVLHNPCLCRDNDYSRVHTACLTSFVQTARRTGRSDWNTCRICNGRYQLPGAYRPKPANPHERLIDECFDPTYHATISDYTGVSGAMSGCLSSFIMLAYFIMLELSVWQPPAGQSPNLNFWTLPTEKYERPSYVRDWPKPAAGAVEVNLTREQQVWMLKQLDAQMMLPIEIASVMMFGLCLLSWLFWVLTWILHIK